MKQAYEEYDGDVWYQYRKIEVLPKCKKVKEFNGLAQHYQLVRRKVFFGLIPVTYWLNKRYIRWFDAPTVEYYDCDCGG